jgi:hypothetical protein
LEVSENFTDVKRQALLVTGDGTFDIRFLTLILKKLNGKEPFLVSPSFPLPNRERRITGLDALRTIALLLGKFNIRACLFCIDKEHIEQMENIEEMLGKYGFQLMEFQEISLSRTYKISVQRGGRALKIILVIFGRETKLEEDIEELARLCGCELPNTRISTIKRILLPRATIMHIKRAFSHLYDAIVLLEKILITNKA